jgi:hypothetical protein
LKGADIARAMLVLLTTPNPKREQVASNEVTSATGADQAELTNEINLPAIPGNFSTTDASSTKPIVSSVSDFNK